MDDKWLEELKKKFEEQSKLVIGRAAVARDGRSSVLTRESQVWTIAASMVQEVLDRHGEMRPRHSCAKFFSEEHAGVVPERISRADFNAFCEGDAFKEDAGPFSEAFGDRSGEPYNPFRQAFGILKNGRGVFCELNAIRQEVVHGTERSVDRDPEVGDGVRPVGAPDPAPRRKE
jgi:hypothetical protein